MGNKKALLVGINYVGTSHELRGCVNDVLATEKVLRNEFGFKDIRILLDAAGTTSNIINELNKLVYGAREGDILYFHYSGHGSQVPDSKYDRDEEPDGLDEIICPVDVNWRDKIVRDDDLKTIFDKVPNGVNLTVVLDCCNSGSGLDQTQSWNPTKRKVSLEPSAEYASRYLPPPEELTMLVESKKLDFHKPRAVTRNVDDVGLLISGCEAHQTSADAWIGGKFMGACTYVLLNTLHAHRWDIGYKTLVRKMNQKLSGYGFTQRPELNGSQKLWEHKFLAPLVEEEVVEEQESEVPPRPEKPKPACRKCKKGKKDCSCPEQWKRRYWRRWGAWRRDYRRALVRWRKALREWRKKYGK